MTPFFLLSFFSNLPGDLPGPSGDECCTKASGVLFCFFAMQKHLISSNQPSICSPNTGATPSSHYTICYLQHTIWTWFHFLWGGRLKRRTLDATCACAYFCVNTLALEYIPKQMFFPVQRSQISFIQICSFSGFPPSVFVDFAKRMFHL